MFLVETHVQDTSRVSAKPHDRRTGRQRPNDAGVIGRTRDQNLVVKLEAQDRGVVVICGACAWGDHVIGCHRCCCFPKRGIPGALSQDLETLACRNVPYPDGLVARACNDFLSETDNQYGGIGGKTRLGGRHTRQIARNKRYLYAPSNIWQ